METYEFFVGLIWVLVALLSCGGAVMVGVTDLDFLLAKFLFVASGALLGVSGLLIAIFSKNKNGWSRAAAVFVSSVLGIGCAFGLCKLVEIRQSEALNASLRDEFQLRSRGLGDFIDPNPVSVLEPAVESVNENAIVLWMTTDEPNAFYIPADKSGKIVHAPQVVNDSAENENPQWHNKTYLDSIFHPPAGLLSPEGGVARRAVEQKEKYGWVGFRISTFSYEPKSLYYQRFENGIVIGPVITRDRERRFIYSIKYATDVHRYSTTIKF